MIEERTRVKVYLDKALVARLWILIKKKYKTSYGALSSEVQDALAHWIQEHEETLELNTNMHKKFEG